MSLKVCSKDNIFMMDSPVQVLLSARNPGQSGRAEACVPVCRRSKDRRHRGGGL